MVEAKCRVSVVVPTFNRGELLRENIASIMDQDALDYELIYANDGSTDATPEVLEEAQASFPGRLRAVHISNSGPGPARNAGARIARGELLLFTDDDVVVPQKVHGSALPAVSSGTKSSARASRSTAGSRGRLAWVALEFGYRA